MSNLFRLATAVLICVAGTAIPAQDVAYQVINSTQRALVQVFSSPASQAAWSEDLLAGEILLPGKSVRVKIATDDQACQVDLLFIFEDGQEMTDTADVCSGRPYMVIGKLGLS